MECINKPICKLTNKVITTFEISSGFVTGVCEIKKAYYKHIYKLMYIIHIVEDDSGLHYKIIFIFVKSLTTI